MSQICIVGSSDLAVSPEIAAAIVGILAALDPEKDEIAIRVTTWGGFPTIPSSPIEAMVEQLWSEMGSQVDYYGPAEGNFKRDLLMVLNSLGGVYAFLAEAVLQEQVRGSREDDFLGGGTGHVITVAINQKVPIEAWLVGDDGVPIYLGAMP